MIINENTIISSKKYNTIGQLLKAPIKSIILTAVNQQNTDIRNYLYTWLYENYYSQKFISGSLTQRVKNIANKPCYYYITNNILDNNDILHENKEVTQILNNDCINFIKLLHNIDACLTGSFLDYLIRRIIAEKNNEKFYDSRADFIQENLFSMKLYYDNKLPQSMHNSYQITKNTNLYKSQNILIEIFITSLSHSLAFSKCPSKDKVLNIINILEIENINELFYTPIEDLCNILLNNEENNIILNPSLDYNIPLLNDKSIAADCDIVINKNLYDIKCCSTENEIYEILQLLGYACLLKTIPEYNIKINTISIINLFTGCIIKYDISHLSIENMVNFLEIIV